MRLRCCQDCFENATSSSSTKRSTWSAKSNQPDHGKKVGCAIATVATATSRRSLGRCRLTSFSQGPRVGSTPCESPGRRPQSILGSHHHPAKIERPPVKGVQRRAEYRRSVQRTNSREDTKCSHVSPAFVSSRQ